MIPESFASLPVHVAPALLVAAISCIITSLFFHYIFFAGRSDRLSGDFVRMFFAMMAILPFLGFSMLTLVASIVGVLELGAHPLALKIRWISAGIGCVVLAMDIYFLQKLSTGTLRKKPRT